MARIRSRRKRKRIGELNKKIKQAWLSIDMYKYDYTVEFFYPKKYRLAFKIAYNNINDYNDKVK